MLRFKAPSKEVLDGLIESAFNTQAEAEKGTTYGQLCKEDQQEIKRIGSFMAFEIYYELSKRIEPELTSIIKAASDLSFPRMTKNLGTEGDPLRMALMDLSQLNPGTLIPGPLIPPSKIEEYFMEGTKVVVKKEGLPCLTEIVEGSIGAECLTFTVLGCDKTYQLKDLLFLEKIKNQPSQQEEVKGPKGV